MREKLGVAAGMLAVLAVGLACKKGSTAGAAVDAGPAASSASVAASAAPPKRGPMPVGDYGHNAELKTLLDDYRGNELRADAQWKGKRVAVEGKVGVVKKGVLDSIYATLGTTGTLFERPLAQAFFDADATDDIAQLERVTPGQTLRISCVVKGLSFNVLLEKCSVVHPLDAQLVCRALVDEKLATRCEVPSKDDAVPGIDSRGFETPTALKGAIATLATDDDFDEEVTAEERDQKNSPKLAKVTIIRSKRARTIVFLDKTALQSEKDAMQAFVDGL